MAASDSPESSTPSGERSLPDWAPDSDDVVLLVAGITLLALLARLVLLGDRIAHWDEGRVAYWIVHYQETGSFAYRRIIHGPFIQHVNRWLFPIWGANDFTMRVPVAVVGGLLPLSALLFREHLRRVEVVAMALFLSFNPVLLYYSRFMRSDVLVAAFMFAAFGFFVRFYDTRRTRYLYAAAAFVAFGFASKENAAVYVLTWLGAAGLLADQALYRPRNHASGYDLLRSKARGVRDRFDSSRDEVLSFVLHYASDTAWALILLFGLLLFFYAPRGAGMEGITYPPAAAAEGTVGFWQGFASPSNFVDMVQATWNHSAEEFGTWFERSTEAGDEGLAAVYVDFFDQFVQVMIQKAAPLTAFAIFGFVLERYGAERSRNLVMFAAYCGFVSVLGYPLGTDIFGAWLVVHALVPLSIPAAVGLARIFDWGYEAFVLDDSVGVAIAAVLLLLVGAQVAAVAVPAVYVNDQSDDNNLVQYAQPGGDPRAELQTIGAVADREGNGTDVLLYYGEQGDAYDDNLAFVKDDPNDWDSSSLDTRPLCARWYNSLPFPWYFAKDDVQVNCSRERAQLESRIQSNPPPVIITQDDDTTVPTGALESSYTGTTYEMRAWGKETTFWIHEDVQTEGE
ncbi:TIGR03663 family protein [Halomicrobium zhouii]|uniref:TIGR03663 family protein n=1 Tax=Halomicrobium zhouii TaxID=767519 RepID=A0A1I6KSC7_9EURY|nr:flippase activity-associated protein Agl23 [Halomicrobium zhouii]SFR94132.1 TIGR03663 family protein [Halomicrobium zhouii]